MAGRDTVLTAGQDEMVFTSNPGSIGFDNIVIGPTEEQDETFSNEFLLAAQPQEEAASYYLDDIFSCNVNGSSNAFTNHNISDPLICLENIKTELNDTENNFNNTTISSGGITNLESPSDMQVLCQSPFDPINCQIETQPTTGGYVTSDLGISSQEKTSTAFTNASSPGSDSGYSSEHYTWQNRQVKSPFHREPIKICSPSTMTSSDSKLGVGSVKLLIPQNVLQTMNTISSVDAKNSLSEGRSVKYLVPVNIEPCTTPELKVSGQIPHDTKKLNGKVNSVPQPLLIVPQKDLAHTSINKVNKAAYHIIKLVNGSSSSSTPSSIGQTNTVSGQESQQDFNLGTRNELGDMGKKAENSAKNRFVCVGCGKAFALNRIILRTGGLYIQGKPQYCINCFENYQAAFQPKGK